MFFPPDVFIRLVGIGEFAPLRDDAVQRPGVHLDQASHGNCELLAPHWTLAPLPLSGVVRPFVHPPPLREAEIGQRSTRDKRTEHIQRALHEIDDVQEPEYQSQSEAEQRVESSVYYADHDLAHQDGKRNAEYLYHHLSP